MLYVTTNGKELKTFYPVSQVTLVDNRLFVEAVIYRYKTGIPWRDLPERFGDFRMH